MVNIVHSSRKELRSEADILLIIHKSSSWKSCVFLAKQVQCLSRATTRSRILALLWRREVLSCYSNAQASLTSLYSQCTRKEHTEPFCLSPLLMQYTVNLHEVHCWVLCESHWHSSCDTLALVPQRQTTPPNIFASTNHFPNWSKERGYTYIEIRLQSMHSIIFIIEDEDSGNN